MTKWMAMMTVAALLAGCGRASVNAPAVPPKSSLRPPVASPPVGGGGLRLTEGLGSAGEAQGAQMLEQMRRVFAECKGFDATAVIYSEGYHKMGEKVSDLRKMTTTARLIWVKPQKLRAEVISTNNFLLEGAALVTTDGRNITARAKGVLGLFPLHLGATDGKLSNNRNHTFVENNPNSQLTRLTAPGAVWTVVGQEGANVLVQVDGVKRLDAEVDREVIAIEPGRSALRGLTMYAGQTKVLAMTLPKFAWNPSVKADLFTL